MTVNFGFSGLNNNLNPNNNNGFNIDLASKLGDLIIPVRVTDILLSESDFDRFKDGGWNNLGAIKYELVVNPETISKNNKDLIALPLNPNSKNYPLINEIIYLISFPNNLIGENNSNSTPYYINIISLWNHPHHNAYPSIANEPNPPQQKDYIQTQAGSARVVTDNNKQIYLGKTFIERPNIHPLLPFEGDIIYEGRWGNSIRLGSTVKLTPNNWSSTGTNGDPITIVRNGQGIQTDQGWVPTTENINNDDSSIYLTSTQNIPLNAMATSYVSYDKNKTPVSPSKYEGQQIILNSGRLVFNAKNDHILLSSAKSINLNSLESVNIDTPLFTTQANKIYLGKYEADEPLMLGKQTVNLMKSLVQSLTTFMTVALTATTVKGDTLPTINSTAQSVLDDLNNLSKSLGVDPNLTDCNITSKRNYTV